MLMKARADPPPQEPGNPIPATAANVAGLPEAPAIAYRQIFAAGSAGAKNLSRRGSIRAVFRREAGTRQTPALFVLRVCRV